MVDSAVHLSSVFMALADPTRRQIVQALATGGPQAVSDLARPFRMSLQAVSKHIGVLTGAGLVKRTRRGRSQVCSLDGDTLTEALTWIEQYRQFWENNLDHLGAFLEKGADS